MDSIVAAATRKRRRRPWPSEADGDPDITGLALAASEAQAPALSRSRSEADRSLSNFFFQIEGRRYNLNLVVRSYSGLKLYLIEYNKKRDLRNW